MKSVSNAVAVAVSESTGKRAKALSKKEAAAKGLAFIKCALTEKNKLHKTLREILQANGLTASPVNLKNVKNIKEEIFSLRRVRSKLRSLKPKTTLASRLEEIREAEIEKYAFKLVRCGARAGTYLQIHSANSNSEVDYRVTLQKKFNFYRGSKKKWPANQDHHYICVPANWRTRVLKRGLAELGGMLTLDAAFVESLEGLDLYAATWVVQERGYSVSVERGFIAVSNNAHFHAPTIDAAIAGLKTKANFIPTEKDLKLSIEKFILKYSRFKMNVSLDDARQSGSCEYGIRSWCHSVGIDINRGEVTMNDILAAFRKLPLSEVRKAVIHSVRKNRNNLI